MFYFSVTVSQSKVSMNKIDNLLSVTRALN